MITNYDGIEFARKEVMAMDNEGYSTSMFIVFGGMALTAIITLAALYMGTKSRKE